MTHRVLGSLLAVAGCCLLAACATSATSEEADDTPVAKPATKEESPPADLAERAPGDYGGIRPPKDLLSLPKDHELKATNPGAGESPPAGGVIVNPAGPPPAR